MILVVGGGWEGSLVWKKKSERFGFSFLSGGKEGGGGEGGRVWGGVGGEGRRLVGGRRFGLWVVLGGVMLGLVCGGGGFVCC